MIGFRALSMKAMEGEVALPPVVPTVLRLAIANAGVPSTTDYKYNTTTLAFEKQPALASPPTSNAQAITVSSKAKWMAVGTQNTPYLFLYKRVGTTWQAFLEAPVPAGRVNGIAFSRNDNYMIVAHNSTPYISVYKIEGETFTQIPHTSSVTSNALAIHYHPTLDMFMTSHQGSPNGACYAKVGEGFELVNTPTPPPSSVGYGCRFSPDGTLAAIATGGGPGVAVYRFSAAGFGERFASPTPIEGYSSRTVAFSKDGNHVFVGHLTSPFWSFIRLNKTEGTFGESLPVPNLPNYGIYMDLSPDGNLLAVARFGSSYLTIFRIDGETVTTVPFGSGPNNNGTGANFYLTVE